MSRESEVADSDTHEGDVSRRELALVRQVQQEQAAPRATLDEMMRMMREMRAGVRRPRETAAEGQGRRRETAANNSEAVAGNAGLRDDAADPVLF